MYRFRKYIVLLMLFMGLSRVRAQHPYYYTINDNNGLPSNEVYQLAQDEFGYMWIGCNSGLFSYDGFKFRQYQNIQQSSVAISGLSISQDKKLYCQNFSGQIFRVDHDSLSLLIDVKEKVRSHPVYTPDKDHNIWVGLPEGILRLKQDGKRELLFANDIEATEIETAAGSDMYVIDKKRGLCRITNKGGTLKYNQLSDPQQILVNNRNSIKQRDNKYYALSVTNDGRKYYLSELRNDTVVLLKTIPGDSLAEQIYSIVLLDKKIWLATSSGAYCLNRQGNIEQHLFPTEKISDIIIDREGNYWFSSLQNGVFVVPDMQLKLLSTQNSDLPDNNITAITPISDNVIYLGTYSGDICEYHIAEQTLTMLPKNDKTIYRNVTSIIPYDDHTIVAGRGIVSVINTERKTEHTHSTIYIRDMIRHRDSIFYASSEKVVVIYDLQKLVTQDDFRTQNIEIVSGRNICFDSSDQLLWVTVNEGLVYYKNGISSLFTINDKPVYCSKIYADKHGLWAGTVSDGIYHIRNRKTVLHLQNTNGLSGNNVKCITSRNDTVYIATDVCINVYYPNGTFSYIDYTDGINSKEVNALALAGNHLLIGTLRGLFYLPINVSYRNNVKPNIVITSVYAEGIQQPVDQPVALKWNNKDLLISFSSAALRSRGRFTYQYRITGFLDEWKKIEGSINYVRLNHLPAGHYTFEVMAVNEDGVTSSLARLPISIGIPFWQHWLFYIFIAILSASLVALLFLLRIKTIRRNEALRNKIATSQLTALKAQMNPHFMYNTLNSIQDLVLQHDIKSTNYYLSRYSSLMRKILDSSESDEIELTEETEILELYLKLEQLRFGSDFTYAIAIEGDPGQKVYIPSMIIQPFVENAIKHGLLHKKGQKNLSITFYIRQDILVCSIKDNGIGRVRSAEIKSRSDAYKHRSFATKATEKRLELININRKNKIALEINDLYDNGVACGTEVMISIPL